SGDAAMTTVLIGMAVTLAALLIQGTVATGGIAAIDALIARRVVGTSIWRNGLATLVFIMVLWTGHLAQMAMWAIAFVVAREFATFAAALYPSAVNYTTLGYGDIVMSARWRLLGPQEAASGMLAFGWSTAAIVTIVIRMVRHRQAHVRRKGRSSPDG